MHARSLILAGLMSAVGVMAQAEIVNVATGPGTNSTNTVNGLSGAGPLSYSGTTWNQLSVGGGNFTASSLLTSTGATTGIGFQLSNWVSNVADHGGSGIPQLLGSDIHADAGSGGGYKPLSNTTPTLIITGLAAGGTYELVLVSGSNIGDRNAFNIGGTPIYTSGTVSGFTGGTTLTTNVTNRNSFIAGNNYVDFTSVTASASGTITVYDQNLAGAWYELNGFQLSYAGTATPEPGTWVLVASSLGGLAILRRKRA